jgi:hypothetical protein
MLSGVLHSDGSIQANVEIMQTCMRLPRLLTSNEVLAEKLDILERR